MVETSKRQKIGMILMASLVVFSLYVVMVTVKYPIFLENRVDDSLPLIHAVTPDLNFITLALALLCLACIYYRLDNRYLHLILLTQLSIMLWLTPSLFAGFAPNPDTYHLGVSSKIMDVLQGDYNKFSEYGKDYPLSFLVNYYIMDLFNLDIPAYGRVLFPAIWTISFVLLVYLLIASILDNRVAFLSTLLTLTGLHFVESHPSPHAFGLLMVLLSLVLIYKGGVKSRILAIIVILLCVVSHPESPLLLITFLIGGFVISLVSRNKTNIFPLSLGGVLMIYVAWISWALLHASSFMRGSIIRGLYKAITLEFISSLNEASASAGNIYSDFSTLRISLIMSYGLMTFLIFLNRFEIGGDLNLKRIIKTNIRNFGEKRMLFLLLIFFFTVVMYAFGVLCTMIIRQRALIYLVISASTFISAGIVYDVLSPSGKGHIKKCLGVTALLWIALLAFMYPTASYYYASFGLVPTSEFKGMKFLADGMDMGGRNILIYRPSCLTTVFDVGIRYEDLWALEDKEEVDENFLKMTEDWSDVISLQKTGYYEFATSRDMSFDDNVMTRLSGFVDNSNAFNKIYSNPTTVTYLNRNERERFELWRTWNLTGT
ncbi:MAG: hypothetical protein KAU03_05580 [Candidatus Altiarchaeales archaeon]|nr:hypothetical protein [Candidatus Altiarchaeales archaeon]